MFPAGSVEVPSLFAIVALLLIAEHHYDHHKRMECAVSHIHPYLSRKLLVAILGVIFAGLASQYPDLRPVLSWIEAPILAYLGAQGAVDVATVMAARPAIVGKSTVDNAAHTGDGGGSP